MGNLLNELYLNRILKPQSITDLPKNIYMVYILTYNEKPIVVGHGKKGRARIIFDDSNNITKNHIKAFLVRLYRLFGNGIFKQYIITCGSKEESIQIENHLHQVIGGNNLNIPDEIRNQLFNNIPHESVTHLILEIALTSSFDGLSDLRKWRNKNLLKDEIWEQISEKLQLNN